MIVAFHARTDGRTDGAGRGELQRRRGRTEDGGGLMQMTVSAVIVADHAAKSFRAMI